MENGKKMTMEERLAALCDVDYDALDCDETQHGCCIGMCYSGFWTVWLTDDNCGSNHTAVAVRMKHGEYTEEYLSVGPSFSPMYGPGKDEFSVCGDTLEEAVSKLEAMVRILRTAPDARLLFTWDD